MKKYMILLCLLVVNQYLFAQKDLPGKNTKIKDTLKPEMVLQPQLVQANRNIVFAPLIRIYERPNYQGRSAQFVKNAEGKFEFPFPLQHVSFKVPNGMIVYIQTCFEFPSENAYVFSQTNVNLEGICGIRTDSSTLIKITFAGISTEIHNDDCMRFAGKVDSKMMETAPGVAGVETLMPARYSSGSRSVIGSPHHFLYNRPGTPPTSRSYDPHYNCTGTIYNNNPVPELTTQAHNFFGHTDPAAVVSFYVGKSALREGRVKIWLNTDLVSAHKTCDLCDDFSSGIKMEAPGYAFIPLNKIYDGSKIVDATHPYVVVGPYMARGSRDGFAITATSGTIKNFRVHLIVNGF